MGITWEEGTVVRGFQMKSGNHPWQGCTQPPCVSDAVWFMCKRFHRLHLSRSAACPASSRIWPNLSTAHSRCSNPFPLFFWACPSMIQLWEKVCETYSLPSPVCHEAIDSEPSLAVFESFSRLGPSPAFSSLLARHLIPYIWISSPPKLCVATGLMR